MRLSCFGSPSRAVSIGLAGSFDAGVDTGATFDLGAPVRRQSRPLERIGNTFRPIERVIQITQGNVG
ncbi:hypothetical protein CQ12_14385 [Bradyrhizobium jicamae]|uniref:Uncharacterized protein n=1 Tax=Bradyrhizobium jicamae TaxID=280332 RepID=A0A0R3LJV1_9BRAD|nr:hypothetical protein CQ12_14385 [Bradyrhizobium jicamae]